MTRYKNNGGLHVELDGTVIPHGATFVSSNDRLCEQFTNKFTKVADEPVAPKADDLPVEKLKADEPAAPKEVDKPAEDAVELIGEDVTAEWPEASELKLTVRRDKRGWYVYDDADTSPVNEKPLKKKEVDALILEYTK